jgi:hypothetical protein
MAASLPPLPDGAAHSCAFAVKNTLLADTLRDVIAPPSRRHFFLQNRCTILPISRI